MPAPRFFSAGFRPGAGKKKKDWPSKPITILMGFSAGSGADLIACMLQPSLGAVPRPAPGWSPIYKPGAGGNVASETVAHAKPDGYTFLLGIGGDARRQSRA